MDYTEEQKKILLEVYNSDMWPDSCEGDRLRYKFKEIIKGVLDEHDQRVRESLKRVIDAMPSWKKEAYLKNTEQIQIQMQV